MCGVAGAVVYHPQLGNWLAPMLLALKHRGPDGCHHLFADQGRPVADPDSQYWTCCLGHARLALVGEGAVGRQPTATPSGNVIASVNGEIYNHQELRSLLSRRGINGVGQSDCDVVPALYEAWGLAGLSKLEGVYAGAIIEPRIGTVILFKDRFGARPIYYFANSDGVFFASEIKALLTLPFVHVDLNYQAVLEYFTFQTPLQRHTLFANIFTLMPGEAVVFSKGDMQIHDVGYSRSANRELVFAEAVDQTRHALNSAMERQWRDGAGAYLSSGIDSNAIVGTFAMQGKQPSTYTAAFPETMLDTHDRSADESHSASEFASYYGLSHESVALSPSRFALALPPMIWHLEDLRMPMSFGSWEISRRAAGRSPVLFSGMGGDELFGGYVDRAHALAPGDASDEAWLGSYLRMWDERMLNLDERRRAFHALASKPELLAVPVEALRTQYAWAREHYRIGPLRRLLALEQSFYLPGLLIVDDRMSMAHGIETRVPLIDYQVANIAEEVPEDFLLHGGMGKRLLRQAIISRVPTSVALKPKQPFRVPESSWYRLELFNWVSDSLLGKGSMTSEFLEPSFVEEVLSMHRTGASNRRRLIWSLISFEYWCRIFLDGQRPTEQNSWIG